MMREAHRAHPCECPIGGGGDCPAWCGPDEPLCPDCVVEHLPLIEAGTHPVVVRMRVPHDRNPRDP